MLLSRKVMIVLFILFLQYAEGSEVIAVASDPEEEASVSSLDSEENGQDASSCCTFGNCTCHSLLHALVGLTDNVMINITTDVMLSSIVPIVGVENITILGYNNPTVYCSDNGGVKITSCDNIIIEGVVWENCGSDILNSSVMAISYSSNLTINNCTFKESQRQALLISNATKYVHIKKCMFVDNSHYKGHGTAIYYTSMPPTGKYLQVILAVNNCSFINNGKAHSVIYINGYAKTNDSVSVQNSEFVNNKGVPIYISNQHIHVSGDLLIKDNMAISGGGIFSTRSNVTFAANSHIYFHNNSATLGGAIYSVHDSVISFIGNSVTLFTDNSAMSGGAIYSGSRSSLSFVHNSMVTFANNNAITDGGAVRSVDNSRISINDNSTLKAMNNIASRGAALHSSMYSIASFKGNSMAIFSNNTARIHGGALFSEIYSILLFRGKSTVIFAYNTATSNGGVIYSLTNCHTYFIEHSNVQFNENVARSGGAIFCWNRRYYSSITFSGSSIIKFHKNSAVMGGAIIQRLCNSLTNEQSLLTFTENKAERVGGAISSHSFSIISFNQNSSVNFLSNEATSGGAIFCTKNSLVSFNDNTLVTLNSNVARQNGGAIYSTITSTIVSEDNSMVVYSTNSAVTGGAVFSNNDGYVKVAGNSNVMFLNNSAVSSGAIHSQLCNISFIDNSIVTFIGNTVAQNGGAMYSFSSHIWLYSTINFMSNNALEHGGAIWSSGGSRISFSHNCLSWFINNTAENGGAFFMSGSSLMFEKDFVVFDTNTSRRNGIVIHAKNNLVLYIDGDRVVSFIKPSIGGSVFTRNSSETFRDSSIIFDANTALQNGGAVYLTDSSVISVKGNRSLFFSNNKAGNGGAIFISDSSMTFEDNNVLFNNNTALQSGGALYLSDKYNLTLNNNSNISFTNNNVDGYGGAIYMVLTVTTTHFNSKGQSNFHNNYARIAGNSLYVTVTKSCDSSCLSNNLVSIGKKIFESGQFSKEISVTPNSIKLHHPATCIVGNRNCKIYYIDNIMLGEEIILDACAFDYYDQPSNAVQFTVTGEDNPNYQLDGVRDILVSCDTSAFRGVSITGNISIISLNYTLTIAFHVSPTSEEESFSIKLIISLSPCHPGFWYYTESQRCVCYDDNDIVYCSGTTSTIKRGYWFGSVNGRPTVAVCPVNYCDFSCCETTDGFYSLSPLRSNQCRSHRSGPACGNCEEGWTLSFDSAECVKTEKCTAGQTALVVTLTVLYWIAVVVAVFVMMHYKIPIGYLYVITYYYSILDALLNQTLYLSQWLLTCFNTVVSIFKIIPQFLGQLCLVKEMSGIDQQFMHYVHPFAVTLILIMISMLTRISYRFSSFISRGIVHVICLLLLLSYTSVATTSLLLMRTLTFLDVDKIYTYLSPDIKYFHGRHLPYAIVAVLCIIVIVIGLPLLLLLEPFLNHKINFTKFKPLLDQFQGCYKNKYHYFAAYYMICRLVIIIMVITTPSNNVLVQYTLIGTCVVMAVIHLILRPYQLNSLNTFDGLILLLIILVSVIPVLDSSETGVLVGIGLFVVLLPLILFVTMLIFKNNIWRKAITHCKVNRTKEVVNKSDMPSAEFCVVVDEYSRRNATICAVDQLQDNGDSDDEIDVTRYRESFMEVMEEIKD